jgi:hypothetical protein
MKRPSAPQALITDVTYDLAQELEALAAPCSKCNFHFPVMPETANGNALFKSAT